VKLSEMKRLLVEHSIQLTKSLGQNFLHDGNQLRRIVRAAQLSRQDKVLEVGPGLGPLTELLCAEAGEVLAIEKDKRLVEFLRGRNLEGGRLTLLHDDALKHLRRSEGDWRGWKLVANLQYSVASPILVELAQGRHGPDRMVATVQWEVARRLMAGAGDEHYGLLTVLMQLHYEPVEWFKIPASCFFPEPDVDSACVVLQRRAVALLPEEEQEPLVRIVKRSFSQRRKMMAKLLKQDWAPAKLEAAFAELKLPAQARAEAVGLDQFVRLARLLVRSSNA
jgi:16S rRNA (adenine1518-N6/adenine1519-N6)-dimethyltransferase